MEEHKGTLKKQHRWFSRVKKVSSRNENEAVPSDQDSQMAATLRPSCEESEKGELEEYLEECNIKKLISKDLELLNRQINVQSSQTSQILPPNIMSSSSRREEYNVAVNSSSSLSDILTQDSDSFSKCSNTIDTSEFPFRPKIASWGSSVSPFKIRDNLSSMLGYELESGLSSPETSSESIIWSNPYPSSRYIHEANTLIKTYPGIPSNRIGLLDHCQSSLYKFELQRLRSQIPDHSIYFKWALWLVQIKNDIKNTYIDRIIGNNHEVKILMDDTDNLIQNFSLYKFHIFKLGFSPSRKSKELIKSDTLEIRVPHEQKCHFFKEVVIMLLRDELYKPFALQIPICGISIKDYPKHSVVSLWLESPSDHAEQNHEPLAEILGLIEFIKESLSEVNSYIMDSAILMNNETSSTTKIFEGL